MKAPRPCTPSKQGATAGLSSSVGKNPSKSTAGQASSGTQRATTPHGGFTLLEVLITTVLVVTLLWSLWTLMSIHTDLFEQGQARTEQSQLVRSLSQLLTDDLRSAIQDPAVAPPKTSRTQMAARRFGMYGTSDYLRIDIIQVPPFPIAPTPTSDEMESSSLTGSGLAGENEVRIAQAPELRTVYYEFVAPKDPSTEEGLEVDMGLGSDQPEARPGLTRRELDFETPDEDFKADSKIQSAIPNDFQIETFDDSMTEEEESFDEILESEPDDSLMWAPEVVGLRFRYFDGRGWQSSWDSLRRKGLPVAVEVNMQISSFDDAEVIHRAAAPEEADLLATVELVGQAPEVPEELQADQPPPPKEHRVVIFLPTSPLYEPRKPKPTVSAIAAVRPPSPPPPPPRPVIRVPTPRTPVKSATKTDRSMRTNTHDP